MIGSECWGRYRRRFHTVARLVGVIAVLSLPGCERSPQSASGPVDPAVPTPMEQPAPFSYSQRTPGLRAQPVDVVEEGDWFEQVPGLSFSYRSGREAGRYFILESLGGGVAMLDYDGDSDLDLFFTGGGVIPAEGNAIAGRPSAMFRNEGNWRFTEVTREAGLADAGDYSHGCAVADYDRDGDPDLFVCCFGRCRLYRNTGTGRFEDVTDMAGLAVGGWNTAAAFADVDGDGYADLYVVRYLEWTPAVDRVSVDRLGVRDIGTPGDFPAAADRLFRNRGDGRFEDVSARAGLRDDGKGLGVLATDINGDGKVDFYVTNDKTANHLYLGRGGFQLEEVGLIAGAATNEYGMYDGSMGVDGADYDGDGRLDLFVTNYEREDNLLYRQRGPGEFTAATLVSGLAGWSRPLVGFGTALADFDGDGRPDLFVANGHVLYNAGQSAYLQPPQLFRNTSAGRFEPVAQAGGVYFRTAQAGRGAAVGDLDNDGGLDLVIVHQDSNVAVLRNRRPPRHVLRVRLRGRRRAPDAVGARVVLERPAGKTVRWVQSGAGYFSRFDPRIVFAVPDASPQAVTVHWPGGGEETFGGLATGTIHELVEGQGGNRDRN